jgi:hypothetical protein
MEERRRAAEEARQLALLDRQAALAVAQRTWEETKLERGFTHDKEMVETRAAAAVAQKAGELEVTEPFKERESKRTTEQNLTLERERAALKRTQDRIDFLQDKALKSQDHAQATSLTLLKEKLADGNITSIREMDDGTVVGITPSGKVFEPTTSDGRRVTAKPTAASGGSDLDALLGGTGPAASAAPATTSAPATGSKTMTPEDIAATAEARGISKASAQRILEQLGYRLAS